VLHRPGADRGGRVRVAEQLALTGFQSAIVRKTSGIRWVGTSAFETNASGNRITSPVLWADSGPLLRMPRHAHAQDMA
jgi:hypothetical protein